MPTETGISFTANSAVVSREGRRQRTDTRKDHSEPGHGRIHPVMDKWAEWDTSEPPGSEQALAFLEPLMELPIQPVTRGLFTRTAGMADRHGISYWDAAILAA